MTVKSINPTTGEVLKVYEEMSSDEVNGIIDKSQDAFFDWRKSDFAQRAELMRRAAEILREEKKKFGRIMAMEMGKPISGGEAEAEKCGWVCDYYADNAERFLMDEEAETDAKRSFVTHRPLGVVLAIMPWNFPFWQVFRFAAPNLMAGNVGLLKHASNVPECSLAIEDVFLKAGFPEGVFRSLMIKSSKVAEVIRNPFVRACTLTGSTEAGEAVAATAGKVIKKTVLELGGSDPYIVLEDADLKKSAEICALSRLINSGQSCIAAKRFLVAESVHDEFLELFVQEMQKYKVGDPLDETVQVGPQARVDLRDDLHRQVVESVNMGAEVVLGGEVPQGPGAFYPPTVLKNVRKGMPAFEEELFGPVAPVVEVKDENEAVRLANDTLFGLGAAVFTGDLERGERIARDELDAGACFVNSFVKSDPRLPFGGVKASGYGRELGRQGILEFVNTKTVYVGQITV